MSFRHFGICYAGELLVFAFFGVVDQVLYWIKIQKYEMEYEGFVGSPKKHIKNYHLSFARLDLFIENCVLGYRG
jgi:hypothetical protein